MGGRGCRHQKREREWSEAVRRRPLTPPAPLALDRDGVGAMDGGRAVINVNKTDCLGLVLLRSCFFEL